MKNARNARLAANRKKLIISSSLAVLALPCAVHAQTAPAATPANVPGAAEIIVTGSRITASGFNAPTPTTVVSIEQLQQAAQPNLFDSIAQLPALQGSVGTANTRQNGGTSFGNNGLSALNLRGLGSIRTLTLLDGQRVVPAYITGIADVSQFPQLLIKRVDVVTGGASASWGSDAVAGVVNFVTDKTFKGYKANLSGGTSTYGDDQSVLAQAAAGWGLMGDRMHIEIAGEYFRNSGVAGGEVGGANPNGRPDAYRSGTTSYALGAQPAGAPQFYAYPYNAQTTTLGGVGLITAGPLAGTAFDSSGNPYAFQYGTGCVSGTCVGGQQDNYITTNTLDNPINRVVGYGRVGFDVTPNWELYATVNVSEVRTSNTPIAYPRKPGNLTMQCSNAYLTSTTIPALCASKGITSFSYGTANAIMPGKETIYSVRRQYRFVLGTEGSFNIGSTPIKFDAYYQHGTNNVHVDIRNMTLNGRYNAAINAVRDGSGNIVCSSATARAAGCIPINIFSGAKISDAAFAWLTGGSGPYQYSTFKEDAASIAFNATPFHNWAGDVSVALGAEWRNEYYNTISDPYGNGVTTETPNTATFPADSLLSTGGNNWFAGNYHNGSGSFNVREAFLEIGLPLLNSKEIGKIDLSLSGRTAHYSTAGNANTWKVGATWDTPLSGLKLRGVVSRDLRAPNLSELFAAPQTANQPVINRATGGTVQVVSATIGNPALKPEIAKTIDVGAVYRPDFIPGLSISFDYYDIRLNQAISTLTNQQVIDLCYNGNTTYCSNVKFTGTLGTSDYPYVISQPFNLASLNMRGFDIEAAYRRNLGKVGMLTLRALATHAISMVSNTGIAGQQIAQLAGNNTETGNGVPKWKVMLQQTWEKGPASVTLTERIISAGYIDPNAIVCSTNCPASTVQNPTYNFNDIPGATYLDIGANYKLGKATQVYFKVDNVFNHRAPPFGGTLLYDPIGRMFRLGVRVAM
ncbi:outer membrane receptor protein involved in Fe transport [Novosphingobium sp. SG751A]|uniref:TonB-dependent receptor plug domain-containing protein n=1 Tax=Novosphingobium sp. SG751A TaxID=2587000 RepID=UPI001555F26F|nr:TonB-dependent receptor [Novosphingobium sp. SG751A]NOW47516.1 outer membrane receptor protein involved in Fe transport [Novosphingobium sp. SG751A]